MTIGLFSFLCSEDGELKLIHEREREGGVEMRKILISLEMYK